MYYFKIFLFCVVMLFVSCVFKNDEKITLKVAYIPIAECVQLYVAKDMGYFEKYGVEVKFVSMSGGSEVLTALSEKKVDVGFSNIVSLVLKKNDGMNFCSVFGGTYETQFNQNHALLIKSVLNSESNDLEDGVLALNTFNNIEELMVKKYFMSIGVDFNKMNKKKVSFAKMLQLMHEGEISVASVVEPYITIALRDSLNGVEKLTNHYLATTPSTLVATYVTSFDVINEKKKALQSFVKAMNDATDFINDNESISRKIIGKYTKIPEDMLPVIELSEFRKDISSDDLDSIIHDMLEFGYLNKSSRVDVIDYKCCF